MILARGKLYNSEKQDEILNSLERQINETRTTKRLTSETVITAADKLGKLIESGEFADDIARLGIDNAEEIVAKAVSSLSRESIEYKIKTELGKNFFDEKTTAPPNGQQSIKIRAMPLGTLLHLAAGNVDGLPAYSVAEGLLTGNVNILKLPQADNGLSVKILMKLIEIEPELTDFIYVFDTPSADIAAIRQMAELSDGIVIWGGEAAVSAVRSLAPLGCRIIEWGHKLGFAYISGYEDKDAELSALAEHILTTKQLLCSSCQTIFIDTDNEEALHSFCIEFLPYLERAAEKHSCNDICAVGERTLRRYNERIEAAAYGEASADKRVYKGEYCSLTICEDKTPELSDMFGNCLVKRLPQSELFSVLRKSKGYLQTAGLICSVEKRAKLTHLLSTVGATRITRAGDMSSLFVGENHDGEYGLQRYVRMVDIQM